jgi:DNA-binding winged helix-turn-helix (wHTH) protein
MDFFDFGPFRLDTRGKTLTRSSQELPLTPKLYDLLLVLVTHAGETLDKSALLEQVWGDTFVEEASVARGVSRLRTLSRATSGPCHAAATGSSAR